MRENKSANCSDHNAKDNFEETPASALQTGIENFYNSRGTDYDDS